MTWLIGHLLAVAIGVSLGLLGGGGSVLALPILVYFMHIPTKPAIAMTLAIVGVVSLLGAIPHWRRGHINVQTAALFGSATMVGAFLGAKISGLPFVTGTLQMLLFAIVMLLAAGFMIRRASASPHLQDSDLVLYPQPLCRYCWLWLLTEGIGVGMLTGLVGVGGGFAIIPALVLLGKMPMTEAIGTSLLIIAFNSLAGLIGYIGQVTIDWQITVSFTFAAALGTLLGSYLSQFVSPRQLQKGFGYFLLSVAAFILFQNRHSFDFHRSSNVSSAVIVSNKLQRLG
jgi:hypothetical protein